MKPIWIAPVTVKTGPGGAFQIASLQDALVCLRADWPRDKRDRPLHHRALRLCAAAQNGEVKGKVAREAFIAAARDAEVLVPERIPDTDARYGRRPFRLS